MQAAPNQARVESYFQLKAQPVPIPVRQHVRTLSHVGQTNLHGNLAVRRYRLNHNSTKDYAQNMRKLMQQTDPNIIGTHGQGATTM